MHASQYDASQYDASLDTIGSDFEDWIAPPTAIEARGDAPPHQPLLTMAEVSYKAERDTQWPVLRDQLVQHFDVVYRNNELLAG